MTASEKIQAFLRERRGRAFCDDCLSGRLQIRPRQQVQQKTSVLALLATFDRRHGRCNECARDKLVIGVRASFVPTFTRKSA